MRKQLQEWQKSLACPQTSKKPLAHLLGHTLGAETRQMAWGKLQVRRPHTRMCIAIETV